MWEAQKEKSSFEVGSEREKMGRLILCSSLITLSSREIFPLLNFSADQCFISIYTKQITFRNFISLFVCWNIWQMCKPLHIPLNLWSLHSPCHHCHCLVIIAIAIFATIAIAYPGRAILSISSLLPGPPHTLWLPLRPDDSHTTEVQFDVDDDHEDDVDGD